MGCLCLSDTATAPCSTSSLSPLPTSDASSSICLRSPGDIRTFEASTRPAARLHSA
jgi:hypothetical protein